jgi:hypothetical protein
MSMSGIAVHEKNGARWVQPPARPTLDSSGDTVRDDRGKVQYSPIIVFDSWDVRCAFSDAAVAAVLRKYPTAFSPNTDKSEEGGA